MFTYCLHIVYILFTSCLHIVCLSKCLSETEQLPPLGSWPSWVLEEATEATCVLNGFHPKGAMCGKTWQNYVQTTYKPCDMCQLDDTKTAGCFAGQASLSLKDAGDNTQKQTHSTAWSKPTHRSSQCHRHVPTTQNTPWVMCFQFRVVFSFKSAYPEVVLGWTEHSCYPGTPRRSISSFRRQAVVMGAESAMFVRAQTRATIIGIWVKKMPSF